MKLCKTSVLKRCCHENLIGGLRARKIRIWWRHQMETFSALLTLCAGNSPVTGEFPSQRPVTRWFDVLFDLRMNKRLSKQSWGWWFETQSWSLWRHCNDLAASRDKANNSFVNSGNPSGLQHKNLILWDQQVDSRSLQWDNTCSKSWNGFTAKP